MEVVEVHLPVFCTVIAEVSYAVLPTPEDNRLCPQPNRTRIISHATV
jgi:hypothetical protein